MIAEGIARGCAVMLGFESRSNCIVRVGSDAWQRPQKGQVCTSASTIAMSPSDRNHFMTTEASRTKSVNERRALPESRLLSLQRARPLWRINCRGVLARDVPTDACPGLPHERPLAPRVLQDRRCARVLALSRFYRRAEAAPRPGR